MSKVELHVYDLSKGLARVYGPLLNIDIDGVWHTGISVHGKEVYFGQGIQILDAGKTHLGAPERVHDLGTTEVPWELIQEYVENDLQAEWNAESYHLLEHNCNHFSEELAQFLTGNSIPEYISQTAPKVAATPLGQMLAAQRRRLRAVMPQGQGRSKAHFFFF